MKDITLSAIKKSFGGFEVLQNASLELIRGEKVGLIGRNGSGKTTIFRLITGAEEPDSVRSVLQETLLLVISSKFRIIHRALKFSKF